MNRTQVMNRTREHGGDIYSSSYRLDYSISVNPLGTPSGVRHAVMRSIGVLEQYPDTKCRDLRRKLSDRLSIPAHWITCGNGAAELIFAAALARRAKRALIISPGFSEYERALHTAGCEEICYYDCSRENAFRIGEDILEWITDDMDMMYLCNPGNPAGSLTGRELVLRILERCSKKGVLLVADESFLELTADPQAHTLMRQAAGHPELLILRSFTKTYAMPGLRLGFLVTSGREMTDRILDSIQPWPVSIPAQMAGEAALDEVEYLEKARILVARELQYMKQNFERIGVHSYDSDTNFLLFEGPENLARLCAKKGILIRDCRNYRGLGPGYFRVSVQKRRENEELCRILSEIYRSAGRYLTDNVRS